MSTATATAAYVLDDAKVCVTGLLLEFAAITEPDVSECTGCVQAVEDRCPDHADGAALAARFQKAAVMAVRAETRDDLMAALDYAADGTEGDVR